MKIHRLIPMIALLSISLLARADGLLPAELPPEQEAVALRTAEARGLAIYRHDRAAALASDALRKLRKFRKEKRVVGWITEAHDDAITVTFVDQTPAALYRATVSDAGKLVGEPTVYPSPVELSTYEKAAAAARAVGAAFQFTPCAKSYNSVVLPDDDTASMWSVYLLPATTKKNVVPIGGSYRVETDGNSVISSRAYTHTCISLQSDPRAVALVMSHLLDSTPTDVHVFWNLWANKAMYVLTPPHGSLWGIENGMITLSKRGEPKE